MTDRLRKKANSKRNKRPKASRTITALFIGALLFALPIALPAQQTPAQSAAKTPAQSPTQPSKAPPQPTSSATPTPTEDQSNPADVADREKAIVRHLNAVLRFYHGADSSIQKVGEPSDLIYRDQTATLAAQIAGFAFQSAQAEATLLTANSSARSDHPRRSNSGPKTPSDARKRRPAHCCAQSAG